MSEGLPVEFAGFVPLPDFFERIDVLLVPSWEEPFGIVLLEAMASGIPVIATDRGGPVEILSGGRHGMLVPARDPASLAVAVRSIAENAALRGRIVGEARERVQKTYDVSKVIPQVEDFYRTVILGSN
jgi:glycosyltransferase involved in cell wall biosynthesis